MTDACMLDAYHEAAHFVVAYALSGYGEKHPLVQHEITLRREANSVGAVKAEAATEYSERDEVLCLYAGYCAEVRLDPSCAELARQTANYMRASGKVLS